jgi:hypothetical protein
MHLLHLKQQSWLMTLSNLRSPSLLTARYRYRLGLELNTALSLPNAYVGRVRMTIVSMWPPVSCAQGRHLHKCSGCAARPG